MPVSRRRLLHRGLFGTAALALFPGAVAAQNGRGPLGIDLPGVLRDLLPEGPLNLLETAEAVISLESEAEVRRLPHSVLEMVNGGGLPSSLDDLYRAALPRLVALIDRASGSRLDGGLGDRAAALLARLHGSERQVPEAFQLREEASADGASGAGRRSVLGLKGMLQEPGLPEAVPEVPPEPPIVFTNSPVVQEVPAAAEPIPEAVADVSTPAPVAAGPLTPPSRATGFAQLDDEYAAYFAAMVIRPERRDDANWYLTMIGESRRRYDAVSARTGVPWYFVGATHALEASFNFRGHLHNGDFPLSQRTRQVPANRPQVWLPPSDWESSAVDALRMMGFAGQRDWSLARTLHRLEAYNGFGYRRRGVPTPYLWSFSEHYKRGKFVADGRWSATARSQQCGAAVMLKMLDEAGVISL